jgi:DNA repair protein RecO (recombination protein O)
VNWTDRAIVLSTRPHGETATIAELFAREHGRCLGLVHGRRKASAALQPGNVLKATWRARLADQLGVFTIELDEAIAARHLDDRLALTGLAAATTLLIKVSAERDPHPVIFDGLLLVLEAMADPSIWPVLYARFEVGLLAELGFALDLTRCAVTGAREDLAFVSPKSGRAVSKTVGAPYAEKLLRLPVFLVEGQGVPLPSTEDLLAGLRLTRFFFERRVLADPATPVPDARLRLEELLSALAKPAPSR